MSVYLDLLDSCECFNALKPSMHKLRSSSVQSFRAPSKACFSLCELDLLWSFGFNPGHKTRLFFLCYLG